MKYYLRYEGWTAKKNNKVVETQIKQVSLGATNLAEARLEACAMWFLIRRDHFGVERDGTAYPRYPELVGVEPVGF